MYNDNTMYIRHNAFLHTFYDIKFSAYDAGNDALFLETCRSFNLELCVK